MGRSRRRRLVRPRQRSAAFGDSNTAQRRRAIKAAYEATGLVYIHGDSVRSVPSRRRRIWCIWFYPRANEFTTFTSVIRESAGPPSNRRGKEEEKEKEEEESGRILSDAGRRGAACGPVALQPPPQLRLDPIVEITCPETPSAKQPPRTNRNDNMLIGLVRDSVLQCFCHSCKAPLGVVAGQRRNNAPFKKPSGKGKPRTKQPKKVKFITTEIRCQEKSKGGLCYEVILAEPTVPKRAPSPPQPSPTQQTAIEDKLKAAEERRLSIEAHKLAALAAKLSKIEEASRKKDELSAAFIAATRESLDAKMNNTEEKREAHIAELKNKLKDHLESVEKTRLSLEQQTEEVRCAVEEKLKTAAAQRDENIKRMLDRLKEHEEQVARVRQGMSERVQQLESQIQGKLEQARERRETIEREQKEKLRNHKENERRAEIVRQNKKDRLDNLTDVANPILPVENETASSG
ncbi:Stathmin-4 [Trachymyrmex zeteki]|uniref:Stathmin-4 n=1 Tax=Mycetomoellerius zeteki TaxID=64791 RepID=A0A151X7S8_9HYME|nr:Stathmin-4 [Trachymyrmex zeteki]